MTSNYSTTTSSNPSPTSSIEEPAQLLLLIESGPAIASLAAIISEPQTHYSPPSRPRPRSHRQLLAEPSAAADSLPTKPRRAQHWQNLNFGNGFADLNLSSSLAVAIDSLAAPPRKETIVLLSTGVDTSSVSNWPLVQQKLNTLEVRILAVSLTGDFRQPTKRKKLSAQERANALQVKEVFGEADKWLTSFPTQRAAARTSEKHSTSSPRHTPK